MKWISVIALVLAYLAPIAHADSVTSDDLTLVSAQRDTTSAPGAFAMSATTLAGYLVVRGLRRRLHLIHRVPFSGQVHFVLPADVARYRNARR